MENAPIFVIAIICAASIIAAFIEGEAAGISREQNPRAFWSVLSLGMGGFGGLLFLSLAE